MAPAPRRRIGQVAEDFEDLGRRGFFHGTMPYTRTASTFVQAHAGIEFTLELFGEHEGVFEVGLGCRLR